MSIPPRPQRPDAAPGAPVEPFGGPRELADLCLACASRREVAALLVEPAPGGARHLISVEKDGQPPCAAVLLPSELADALIARVALVAKLDVASPEDQVGRLQVKVGATNRELLVALAGGPRGLSLDLRRVVGIEDVSAPGMEPGARAAQGRAAAYEILEEIGRGGMGVVHRARHLMLDRVVALKVLRPELAQDPQLLARFVREGRAASRAQSTGVVAVTDSGTMPDGRAFLVMELVEWPTLLALLGGGALPPARAVAIARNIAAAIEAPHASGVVHRDLKPQNVFVGPEDAVKIGDFGAAKIFDRAPGSDETQGGMIWGSPHYMAPEHAMGTTTDERTDLYAIGCILFEMLVGMVPFDGPTPMGVMIQQTQAPIPQVRSPLAVLPEVLVRTVSRALAKAPEDRFQTAAELASALDRSALALGRRGWRRWLPS